MQYDLVVDFDPSINHKQNDVNCMVSQRGRTGQKKIKMAFSCLTASPHKKHQPDRSAQKNKMALSLVACPEFVEGAKTGKAPPILYYLLFYNTSRTHVSALSTRPRICSLHKIEHSAPESIERLSS